MLKKKIKFSVVVSLFGWFGSAALLADHRSPDEGRLFYDGQGLIHIEFMWTHRPAFEFSPSVLEIDISVDEGYFENCELVTNTLPESRLDDSSTAGTFDQNQKRFGAGTFSPSDIEVDVLYRIDWQCTRADDAPESTDYVLSWQELWRPGLCFNPWCIPGFEMLGDGNAIENESMFRIGETHEINWDYEVTIGGRVMPDLEELGQMLFGDLIIESTTPSPLSDVCLTVNHPSAITFVKVNSSGVCRLGDDFVECCSQTLEALGSAGTTIDFLWGKLPVLDVELTSWTALLTPNGPLEIHWTTENIRELERMVVSLKRDAVDSTTTVPDNINWARLADTMQNNKELNDKVPATLCGADDWRFYVRHAASGLTAASDTLTISNAPPCAEPAQLVATQSRSALVARINEEEEIPIVFNAVVTVDGVKVTSLDLMARYPRSEDLLDLVTEVDVKPGSDENPINYASKGKIPVAILSSVNFDVPAMIDPPELRFGNTGTEESLHYRGNGEPNCSSDEDHNDDGLLDLLCHFNTPDTSFQPGDTEAILRGLTLSGDSFEGRDTIRIVGPHIFSSNFESGGLSKWIDRQ